MSTEQPNPWEGLRLNHGSPVPMWVQLARELRRVIAEENLPVGKLLPPEHWLITRYGLTAKTTGKAINALADVGQIGGRRGVGLYVTQEIPLEYVTVEPGSKITAPSPHDTAIQSNLPSWAVISLRVEAPGKEPVYFDSVRTVLIVA